MAVEKDPRPVAAITGASSGIGAAFAERLARDGYDLVVVARRRERLETLAQKLYSEHGTSVEVVAADLARDADLHALEERLAATAALDLLVNNAGFSASMPFASADVDRLDEMIRVQVLAVTRLTRAALPGMIARKHGAIINVSSRLALTGTMPSPPLNKRAVYAATKAYLNTFTQILHDELQGTGVQVQALLPGVVWTEFYSRHGMTRDRFPAAIVQEPEDVVTASLAGLRLGELYCIPALDDPARVNAIGAAEREVWDHSGGAKIAKRYGASEP